MVRFTLFYMIKSDKGVHSASFQLLRKRIALSRCSEQGPWKMLMFSFFHIHKPSQKMTIPTPDSGFSVAPSTAVIWLFSMLKNICICLWSDVGRNYDLLDSGVFSAQRFGVSFEHTLVPQPVAGLTMLLRNFRFSERMVRFVKSVHRRIVGYLIFVVSERARGHHPD